MLDFVLNTWLPLIQSSKYSWRVDERISRQHILPYFGSEKIGAITPEAIQKWLDEFESRNFATSTRNRILYVLKDIFKVAEDLGFVAPGRSPLRNIYCASDKRQQSPAVTRAQFEGLLARLGEIDRPEARAIALLALTGASKNEVLSARWENYFPERKLLTLQSAAGKKRHIWLGPRAQALLEAMAKKKSGPWLFPGRNRIRHITQIFPLWNQLRKECGLGKLRLQDLRHGVYTHLEKEEREETARHGNQMPVAIIGVGMRFPGKVTSLDGMWELLESGKSAISRIPADRWPVDELEHPSRSEQGRSVTFAAGVIDDVDQFDPSFFGISPREAAWMDPQQRVLLEITQEALDDAGIPREKIAGSQCGVYIGISGMDYGQHALADLASMTSHTMTGNTMSIAANRLSYVFDLRGPSLAIDTACSSGLAAVHHACQALRSGEAAIAIAGGVNLLMHPYSFIGFSHASMLSASGQCRPFDAAGDGYVRGEGAGVLVLKPLEQAIRDGDHIHAVILASGVNSDGARKSGLTIPSAEAQGELMREVLAASGLEGGDVDFVEAHGTGTPAGDPVEAASIGQVYGQGRTEAVPMSSAKANFGHLEPASGMVGLMRAILSIRHGRIPPMPFEFSPNPNIDFAALNVQCVAGGHDLPSKALTGAVNSFGFGGLNAHLLLASPPGQPERAQAEAPMPPLVLSAANDGALRDLARDFIDRLRGISANDYYDLAHEAALHRSRMQKSLLAWADDPAGVSRALEEFLEGHTPKNLVRETSNGSAGGLAFVYSGNGAQWHGMGRQLYEESPEFASIIESLDKKMRPLLNYSVKDYLLEGAAGILDDTTISQPLLFALQVAITQLMERLGVKPDAVAGHSVGEVAAAWASGALSLEQAIQVIHARSQSQSKTHGSGKMAAVGLSGADLEQLLAKLGLQDELSVAAANSPGNATVSGSVQGLQRLETHLKANNIFFRLLDLEYAFHSPHMEPARRELESLLTDLKPAGNEDAIFVSTVTGGAIEPGSMDKNYWWLNMRGQVNFDQAIRTLANLGMTLFVEIGPHAVLQRYMRENLGKEAGRIFPTLQKSSCGYGRLRQTAGAIHLLRERKHLGALFPIRGKHVSLPLYPWQRQRCWFQRTCETWPAPRRKHPLLGWRLPAENPCWENILDPRKDTWLYDHKIGGVVIFPGAAFMELALEAASEWLRGERAGFEHLDILRPLVFEDSQAQELRVEINSGDGSLAIMSRARLSGNQWVINARARIVSPPEKAPLPAQWKTPGQVMDAAILYGITRDLGLEYGPAFRKIKSLAFSDNTIEAEVTEPGNNGFLLDPGILDACFHSIAALYAGQRTAFLPTGAARLDWYGSVPASIRATLTRKSGRTLHADFELLDEKGNLAAVARDCRFRAMPARDDTQGHVDAWRLVPWLSDGPQPASMPSLQEIAAFVPQGAAPVRLWFGEILPALEAIALAGMAGIYSRYAANLPDDPYFVWMGKLLEREGLLQEDGNLPDWRELWLDIYAQAPQFLPRLLPLARVLEHLPALFEGHVDNAELYSLIRNNVICEGKNWPTPEELELDGAIESLLGKLANRLPEQKLSILELGESRLAENLAATLEPDRFSFVAVSPSPGAHMADRLKAKFVDFEHIAANPAAWISGKMQTSEKFDIVILRQSLHRAHDLLTAMDNLRSLLKPDGLAIVVENYPDWNTDIIDGLEPGWWQTDAHGQPLSSRMPPEGWQALLREHGMEENILHVDPAANGLRAGSFLILAKNSDKPVSLKTSSPAWEVIGATPFAESLAGDLEKEGLLWTGGEGPHDYILSFSGEDLPEDLGQLKDLCVRLGNGQRRIALLTRGGSLAGGTEKGIAHDPRQAALTGFGRVIRNEYPEVDLFLLDVADDDPSTRQALIRELRRQDHADEAILARGARYLPKIVPFDHCGRGVPKRCRLEIPQPGRLDNLLWLPLEAETPGPDDVEIRVAATGLNFRDIMLSMGLLPEDALERGFAGPTLGLEFSGTVVRVGANVRDLAPGDHVAGFGKACFSSHVVTPAQAVAKIPQTFDLAAASSVPTIFITAWYALKFLANVQPGENVLIHGGAGGVGLAAIQICKYLGAKVYVTAGTPEKRDLLATLGADGIFDSRSLDFADEIMAATGGIDVALNSLAGEAMRRTLSILKPFGRFLELGKRDYVENTSIGLRPLKENISYFSIDVDQLLTAKPELAARLFKEVMARLEAGDFMPPPCRIFDAAHVKEAFRTMQQARHMGKIVVSLDKLPVLPARNESGADVSGTWLVTGGVSGFGLETARHLAREGAGKLILVSRRGPNVPDADAIVAEFAALGSSAELVACDICDQDAVKAMLAKYGPDLTGIIHAAAVFNDKFLPDMTKEDLAISLDPKLVGALNLHAASLAFPIRYFILYSSISVSLGNPGQGNYVAANSGLESLVNMRCQLGLPALCVAWGPVGDAGYLARNSRVGKALAARLGRETLSARDALSSLDSYLGRSGVFIVANVDWSKVAAFLESGAGRMDFVAERQESPEADAVSLAAMTPQEAELYIKNCIVEEAAKVLELDQANITEDRSLQTLGMDSLMAMELALAIEQRTGAHLPPMLLQDGPTVGQLAQRLAQRIHTDKPDAGNGEILNELARRHSSDLDPQEIRDVLATMEEDGK